MINELLLNKANLILTNINGDSALKLAIKEKSFLAQKVIEDHMVSLFMKMWGSTQTRMHVLSKYLIRVLSIFGLRIYFNIQLLTIYEINVWALIRRVERNRQQDRKVLSAMLVTFLQLGFSFQISWICIETRYFKEKYIFWN